MIQSDWFSVEPLDAHTYAISEYLHREQTHCYLLLGEKRALLIDTGLGVADLSQVICRLTSLPVQVVTTHAHWDHIGGHSGFKHIAVHSFERAWISGGFPLPLELVKQNLKDENCTFPADFRWQNYQLYTEGTSHVYQDGTAFDLGGRCIRVLHTPGHSPGHCCFYEESQGWLYSGDLIYAGKLDAFYPTTDPVQFYHSVQRIAQLSLTRVLPGHHTLALDVSIIHRIESAFAQLNQAGKLHHGSGMFDFGEFQIHI